MTSQGNFGGYRVLIVDDSASMRKIVRKVLLASGFQVAECFEAEHGIEALEVLEQHPVDLVLTDINMPEMNGVEFMRELRKNELWEDLPVVLITTETRKALLKEAISLGARGYLRKPFKPETIRSLLTDIMGEPDDVSMAADDEGCDF